MSIWKKIKAYLAQIVAEPTTLTQQAIILRPPTGVVYETCDGKFALVDQTGMEVKEYIRRRDAIRGAERLGIPLDPEV